MKSIIILLLLSFSINPSTANTKLIDEVMKEFPKWDKKTIKRIQTYAPILIELSEGMNIDSQLVLSIAWTESHFNPNSTSHTGDKGIMQVQPSTQKWILKKRILGGKYKKLYYKTLKKYRVHHSILDNMFAGILYIDYLLEYFNGDIKKVVVAYNRGPRGVKKLIAKEFPLDDIDYLKKVNIKLAKIED